MFLTPSYSENFRNKNQLPKFLVVLMAHTRKRNHVQCSHTYSYRIKYCWLVFAFLALNLCRFAGRKSFCLNIFPPFLSLNNNNRQIFSGLLLFALMNSYRSIVYVNVNRVYLLVFSVSYSAYHKENVNFSIQRDVT